MASRWFKSPLTFLECSGLVKSLGALKSRPMITTHDPRVLGLLETY